MITNTPEDYCPICGKELTILGQRHRHSLCRSCDQADLDAIDHKEEEPGFDETNYPAPTYCQMLETGFQMLDPDRDAPLNMEYEFYSLPDFEAENEDSEDFSDFSENFS